MKAIATVLLGILVVISFGVLWSLHNPAKSAPMTQVQQVTGKEEHQIDLAKAIKLIKKHKANPAALSVKGGFFARSAFEKILSQEGCIGIRYYYAATDENIPTLVLVGVDAKGVDMQTGYVMEVSRPCPPFCDGASELEK